MQLSGVWLGVELRTDTTRETCVQRRLDGIDSMVYIIKAQEDIYDHLTRKENLHFDHE